MAVLTLSGCSLNWSDDYRFASDSGPQDVDGAQDEARADAGGDSSVDAGCTGADCQPEPVGDCADPALHDCDTEPFACQSEEGVPGHTCGCPAGYEGDGVGPEGCVDIDECALDTAACDQDPAVPCNNTTGGFECGPCPESYAGDGKGEQGCLPSLASLTFSKGVLTPAFDPAVSEYALVLKRWQDRVDATASAYEGQELRVDGSPVTSGQPASLSVSADGTRVDITVTGGGASRTYSVAMSLSSAAPQYIKASNRGAGDGFGYTVSVSGDGNYIAAGAAGEDGRGVGVGSEPDDLATDAGAVYVYHRTATGFEETYVKSPYTRAGDDFGRNVVLSKDGSVLVVGAPGEDASTTGVNGTPNTAAAGAGAAYVYRRTGDTWAFEAYLKAHNTGAGDAFGTSIGVSDDGATIVVCARNEDSATNVINGPVDDTAANAGAAYVFQRTAGTWAQQAFLKASNAGAGDGFGYMLQMSGDGNVVLVGAPSEDSSTRLVGSTPNEMAMNAGAAYVFRRRGTTWSHEAYLKASNPGAGDGFGGTVALSADGRTVLVGAAREDGSGRRVGAADDDAATDAGAAYVFVENNGAWTFQVYLKPSNLDAGDFFSESASLNADGTVLTVSSIFDDAEGADPSDNSLMNAGVAFVFVRTGNVWSEKAVLKAPHPAVADSLGDALSVDHSGSTIVAAAPAEDSSSASNEHPNASASDSGAFYVY